MLFKFRKLTRRSGQTETEQPQQQQQPQVDQSADQSTKPCGGIVRRLSRSLSMMRRRHRSRSASKQPATTALATTNDDDNNNNNGDNISNCSSIELVRQQINGRQSRASSAAGLMGSQRHLNLIGVAPSHSSAALLSTLAALHHQQQERPLHQFLAVASSPAEAQMIEATKCQQQQQQSPVVVCIDDDVASLDDGEVIAEAAAPALAVMSNFDNCLDPDQEQAQRRVNYARRNIGALRSKTNTLGGNRQEAEWLFKLYDLPGSEIDRKKDMMHVAKSIRKTLVSSLTPLLVSTTSALAASAQHAVDHQVASHQQAQQAAPSGQSGTNSTSTAPTVHLHITMTPEIVVGATATTTNATTSPDCRVADSASPGASSNSGGDAVCLVRVSASISSDEQTNKRHATSPDTVEQRQSPLQSAVDEQQTAVNNKTTQNSKDKTNSKASYSKTLRQIDDVMLQSMPAELMFDNRALMKNDKRLRRVDCHQRLVDSGVQTNDARSTSQRMVASVFDDAEKDVSPVFFQQQILLRNERRMKQQQQQQRQAKLVSLAQPVPHPQPVCHPAVVTHHNVYDGYYQPLDAYHHYQQLDDLYSETSILGTYEERHQSIAKCLDWMTKIDESDDGQQTQQPQPQQQQRQQRRRHRQPQEDSAESSSKFVDSAIALGGGEALASCPCNRQVHHHHHHVHQHKHFVARI